MLIHGKQFSELEETDLKSLIEDKVSEGKNIEYKRELPGKSDRAKKEFLGDISSFANSEGGYIFFGISEENGLPIKLTGLTNIDPDSQILRLENLLRDAIAPRLSGINIRSITAGDNNLILAAHIPKSWTSPHMVTFAGGSKFYARNSAGKYPLDVFELRTAFNATNIEGERLRAFRFDRISKIYANDTPVPLITGPKIVLHLIPSSSFDTAIKYDLTEFQLSQNRANLAPISAHHGSNLRFNFDGVLTSQRDNQKEPATSYLQLFRNGIIESSDTYIFLPEDTPPTILGRIFEPEIVEAFERFIKVQNFLETEPPYFLMLSLLGVKGYSLPINSNIIGRSHNLIDRNDLLVPEILVEDITLPAETILRPAFDAVWNAAGQPRSPFYDDKGNWKLNRS